MLLRAHHPARLWPLALLAIATLVAGCAVPFTTQKPVATPNVFILPTLTPSPTPILPISPATAWGAYRVTHLTLPTGDNISFFAEDVAPDGSIIVGVYRVNQTPYIAAITVATRQLRLLYTLPHDFMNACVQTDGRYVGWAGGNEGEGSTSGHEIVGYADVVTGQVHPLAEVNDYSIPDICSLDSGKLIWAHPDGSQMFQIMITDLASGATTALHVPQIPISYEWPYALYASYNQSQSHLTIHLLNLATRVDTPVTALDLTGDYSRLQYPLALAGTTIVRLQGNSPGGRGPYAFEQLQEVDHADQPGAVLRTLTQGDLASSSGVFEANDRLIVIARPAADGNGMVPYIWDRSQQRLIAFPKQAGYFIELRGKILALAPMVNEIDLIDTSQLPSA